MFYWIIFQFTFFTGIVFAEEYFETYFVAPHHRRRDSFADTSRNAIHLEQYKWPNAEVPYVFSVDYHETDRRAVLNAMEIIHNETCVRFIPIKPEHLEHIKFGKSSDQCGSYIGYRANRAAPLDVIFTKFCLQLPGAIQHELLHVLGLLHEQSRPDRDEYIRILWDNISPQYFGNFMKVSVDVVETFGLPYDYASLMHYPGNAFAKTHRNRTIVALIDPAMQLGQSDGPTFLDLEKVRRMYKCQL